MSASSLGLPSRRAKELRLVHAWGRAAGEPIVRRTEIRVRRGVLEIDVTDRTWSETLIELAPRLAARLAGQCPGLGLRRYRIRCSELTDGRVVSGAIGEAEVGPTGVAVGEATTRRSRPRHDGAPATSDPALRLQSVMERYLERGAENRAGFQKP